MRSYEKRDEDKVRTDKAKNDFESIIYSMRDWINDESNQPFIPSDDVDKMLNKLSSEEEWLLDGEGDTANLIEYNRRFNELN
jgi:hypothetical protein